MVGTAETRSCVFAQSPSDQSRFFFPKVTYPLARLFTMLTTEPFCLVLIIHAFTRHRMRSGFVSALFFFCQELAGVCFFFFSPSVLLVSQNLLQMESEISAPQTYPFGLSPKKVLTLTFPAAYAIRPTNPSHP